MNQADTTTQSLEVLEKRANHQRSFSIILLIISFILLIIILLLSWKVSDLKGQSTSITSNNIQLSDGSVTSPKIAEGAVAVQQLSPQLQQFITQTQQVNQQITQNLTSNVPGPQGLTGATGLQGIQGSAGTNGATGPVGPPGPPEPITSNLLNSTGNNLDSTVNGVGSNVVSIINSNTATLTQAGGLTSTVNGVVANQVIPAGTTTQLLGFTGAGAATYQSVASILSGNTTNALAWIQGTSTLTSTVNGVASNVVLTCPTTTTFICQDGNSFSGSVIVGSNNAQSLAFETNGLTQANIAVGGATTFQNTTNSTGALRVINAAGTNTLLTADTINSRVIISSGTSITSPGTGSNSEKFGLNASVGANSNAVAIGNAANVGAANTIAFGRSSSANSADSIAIGFNALTNKTGGIAIGSGAAINAFGAGSGIAIGQNIGTNNTNSIAVGFSNSAGSAKVIYIGNNTTDSTGGFGTNQISIGDTNTILYGSNVVLLGHSNFAGDTAIAIGLSNVAGGGTIAIGHDNNTGTNGDVAIVGNNNTLGGGGSNFNFVFGRGNTAVADVSNTLLIGQNNSIGSLGSARIFGQSNSVTAGAGALLVGVSNTSSGTADFSGALPGAFGDNNTVSGNGAIAIGHSIINSISSSIQIGSLNSGKLTILSTGSVDIGAATSPTNKLTVTDNFTTSVAKFNSGAQQCTVIAGTGWSCTSDISVKANIVNMSEIGTLAKLGALQPVTYQWKDQYNAWVAGGSVGPAPDTQYGFVAQQVETILPEVIDTDPQTGLKMINYGRLNTFMITALKENYGSIQAFQATFNLSNPAVVTINRNVVAAGSLEVQGTSQFDGTSVLNGATTFNGAVTQNGLNTFNATVRFTGSATFDGVTNVNGRLQLGTSNTGSATILAGGTSVRVNFPTAFSSTPNVGLTPRAALTGQYWVSNVTTTGFDVNLISAQAGNIDFYWQAL